MYGAIFLRELVASGDISVKYLQSEEQRANILTRTIGTESSERHRDFRLGRIEIAPFESCVVVGPPVRNKR